MFYPFFCAANVYRPSLGKVRLGYIGQPKTASAAQFYSDLYALQRYRERFSIFIFIYLKKNIENVSKTPVKILNNIYNNVFFLIRLCSVVVIQFWVEWSFSSSSEIKIERLKRFWNFKNPTFGKTHFNNIFTMKIN